MAKKRVAIVGYGGMGGWHTRFIKDNGVVNLLGIYDIKKERCDLAEERGIHAYSSFEEVLSDERVDFVVIATPNELHKPLAIEAMSRGKHVISEKPVTLSSADLQEIIDASHKYGRLFTTHQNRRWDVDYLMMKDVYATRQLGEVFTIESRYHGSRGIPGDWRGKKEHGGGMILDWGVHLIDQMLGIVYDQKITKIYCRCDHLTNDEVDDGFKLDIFFERGLVGHIEVCTRNFISLPRFYMTGTAGAAIINDWRDRTKVISCKTVEEGEVKPVVTAAGMTKTMAPRSEDSLEESYIERMDSDVHDYYRNFTAAIRGEAEQIVKHNQMRRVLRVIEAAFESDKLGKTVDFEEV